MSDINRDHNSKCVAVTGASGFLGSHVVRRAAAQNLRIQPIGRSVDIRDPEEVKRAIENCDAVIHLAGVIEGAPTEHLAVNVQGTVNVLKAVAEHGNRAIFASSLAARDPQGPYGLSKRHAEEWCRVLAARSDMDLVVLRFSSLYGPGARWNSLHKILASDPVELTGDGSQVRDFLHVEEAAEAVISALSCSGVIASDVGSEVGVSLNEIAGWTGREVVYHPDSSTGPSQIIAHPPKIPWEAERMEPESLEAYVKTKSGSTGNCGEGQEARSV